MPCGALTKPAAPLQRIQEGRFTKEAFIRDGPPKGYYKQGSRKRSIYDDMYDQGV
jgi:hypothetical protein